MTQPYYWLNEESKTFLERGYLSPGESAEERIKFIADTAEKILGIKGFSEKFQNYMSYGWYSLSTPIWCNYGLDRGLPISCFGVDIQDDMSDILRASSEIGMMAKYGGGTAGNFSNIRPRGSEIKNNGQSSGAVHFMDIFQTVANTVNQGSARRGHFAAYIPIDHKDINEFLECRSEGSKIQDISLAVTIPSGWMKGLENRDKEKEEVWVKLIKKRYETGYPYILFEDNVNKGKPKVYKDLGLNIKTSQMCSEILEYVDEEKSFTCCLSSMNLLHFDDWKDTDAVEVLTYFLDTVYTLFIEKAKDIKFFEKAVKFAKEHRSIGVGALGYHSYLQSKMIPFESMEAKMLNVKMFKLINDKTLKASKELAEMFGEPEILKGYGERFTTRVAVAPTTSSSFILGQVSPSI